MHLLPSGMQNFFEGVIGFLLAQMEDIVGEKKARTFFAVVATIFIYVIASNWFGLLPFFNAVGKTEDVGYHVWHELSNPEPHDLVLVTEENFEEGITPPIGTYLEDKKFSGVKMDGGSVFTIKPGAKAVTFMFIPAKPRARLLTASSFSSRTLSLTSRSLAEKTSTKTSSTIRRPRSSPLLQPPSKRTRTPRRLSSEKATTERRPVAKSTTALRARRSIRPSRASTTRTAPS